MFDLATVRWQKHGHDRLYVKTPAGTSVGWVDLKTGAESLDRPDFADAFHATLDLWRFREAALGPTALGPAATADAPPASGTPPEPNRGRDLSLNRPGETVRAKAIEEWSAAKERHPVIAPVARFLDFKTDERAWRVGAAGEEKVGPKLEKLNPMGWRVLHSVPVGAGDSDIDHVLIGPGGVFTINTKFHPGARVWVATHQIRINGQPVPYLRNSRFEGERAAKLLTKALGWEVPVKPALVLLTGGLQPNVTYKRLPDDVLVLDIMDLPRVFKRRTGVLGADAVEAVFEVARWERTWVR